MEKEEFKEGIYSQLIKYAVEDSALRIQKTTCSYYMKLL